MNYTEDDTFDRLRRISPEEFERRFEVQASLIQDNTRRRVTSELFVRQAEKRAAWKQWFIGPPERVFLTDMTFYQKYTDDKWKSDFEGTGWTTESYQAYVEAGLQEKIEYNEHIDKTKSKITTGIYLLTVLSIVGAAFVGVPLYANSLIGIGIFFVAMTYKDIISANLDKKKDFNGLV